MGKCRADYSQNHLAALYKNKYKTLLICMSSEKKFITWEWQKRGIRNSVWCLDSEILRNCKLNIVVHGKNSENLIKQLPTGKVFN